MNWFTDAARRITPKRGGAHLYGVVLYTEQHLAVRKMLDDPDYWAALDQASGACWAVFAVSAKPGTYGLPSGGREPNRVYLLLPEWKEPKDNLEILDDFNLDDTRDLPLLLLLTEDDEGVEYSVHIQIDGSTVEEVYASTASSLALVARAIERMEPDLRTDAGAIRRAVFRAVRDEKEWRLMSKGVTAWKRLRALVPGL